MVTPTGNVIGASFVGINTPSTTSVADAIPRITAVVMPVASTVTAIGAVTIGAVTSTRFTVISCVAVALLPFASVAVQVTMVTPTGKVVGASLVMVTANKSVAVAVPVRSVTGKLSPELAVMAAGTVMTGAVVSVTVTNCVVVPMLPAISVAV